MKVITTNRERWKKHTEEVEIEIYLMHVHMLKLTSHWASYSMILYRAHYRNAPETHTENNITIFQEKRRNRKKNLEFMWNVLWNWKWSFDAIHVNGIWIWYLWSELRMRKEIWFDPMHLSLWCHTSADKM